MKMKKILSAAMALAMVASMSTSAMALELDAAKLADTTKLDVDAGTYDGASYNTADADGEKASTAIVVEVTEENITTFKVTVPIKLHVTQKADGTRLYENSMKDGATEAEATAKIINECSLGQVKVSDVKVVPSTGYEIKAFDADTFANAKVNSKIFGMKLNGVEVQTDGTVVSANAPEVSIHSTLVNKTDGKTDLTRVYGDYTFGYKDADRQDITPASTPAFPAIDNKCVLPINYEVLLPAFNAAVDNVVYGGVVFTVAFN